MRLLERSLEKITSLLRVGFGEAGAGIIRANLNMQGDQQYTVCVGATGDPSSPVSNLCP